MPSLFRTFAVIVLAAAALGGCRYYTETIPDDPKDEPIYGGWQLVAMQAAGAAELPVATQGAYTVEFATNNRLAGRADCNRFYGGYEHAKNGQIQVLALGVTQAACPPESLSGDYLKFLGAATRYEIRAGRLRLTTADGSTLSFAR